MANIVLRVRCMGGNTLPNDDHQCFVTEKSYSSRAYSEFGLGKGDAINKAFNQVTQMILNEAFYGSGSLRAPYQAILYVEGHGENVLSRVYKSLGLDVESIYLAPKPACPTCGKQKKLMGNKIIYAKPTNQPIDCIVMNHGKNYMFSIMKKTESPTCELLHIDWTTCGCIRTDCAGRMGIKREDAVVLRDTLTNMLEQ